MNNCSLRNLGVPNGRVDAVLDTDAYNEIDDQYAIAYFLKSTEKINAKAIFAAPFLNEKSVSAKDGMEKSYDEILKVLKLTGCCDIPVYKGSESFLKNETEPVHSEAAYKLCEIASGYSPDKPLYVVAIAALTNIASAMLINPEISKNIVIVWLGGHALHYCDTKEFNMYQDVAAARIVFSSGAALVQVPCMGVVSQFVTTKPELEYWLSGKTDLSTYLAENTINEAKKYADGKPWSRVIWDVTAVAWLLNDGERFMKSRLITAPTPTYDNLYAYGKNKHLIRYVYYIERDALFEDLFGKILN